MKPRTCSRARPRAERRSSLLTLAASQYRPNWILWLNGWPSSPHAFRSSSKQYPYPSSTRGAGGCNRCQGGPRASVILRGRSSPPLCAHNSGCERGSATIAHGEPSSGTILHRHFISHEMWWKGASMEVVSLASTGSTYGDFHIDSPLTVARKPLKLSISKLDSNASISRWSLLDAGSRTGLLRGKMLRKAASQRSVKSASDPLPEANSNRE